MMNEFSVIIENVLEAVALFGEGGIEFQNKKFSELSKNKSVFTTLENLAGETLRDKRNYSIRFAYKTDENGTKKEFFVFSSSALLVHKNRDCALVSAVLLNDMLKSDQSYNICSNCKDVEVRPGQWEKVESFIRGNLAGIQFSHTICLRCRSKLYPPPAAGHESPTE